MFNYISTGRKTFNPTEVKFLLSIYKEHSSMFKSNLLKHDVVWKKIADKYNIAEIHSYCSAKQLKNKFNKLKMQYYKIKDHNSKTGSDVQYFKYEEEFNELFGKSPTLKPHSVVESSEYIEPGTSTINETNLLNSDCESDLSSIPLRKKRKNTSEKMLDEIKFQYREKKEMAEEKNKLKIQHHNEKLEAIKELSEVLKEGNRIYQDGLNRIIDRL